MLTEPQPDGKHQGEGLSHISGIISGTEGQKSSPVFTAPCRQTGALARCRALRLHCCVFVLIITCHVCNTMGRAQSSGFVMQGSAAAKTQS